MTQKTLNARHALESCTFQLQRWNPFQSQIQSQSQSQSQSRSRSESQSQSQKVVDSDLMISSSFRAKKPCRSDRATAPSPDNIDLSRLTLLDDDRPPSSSTLTKPHNFPWFPRKRRRRPPSRSVSGRSSDRSATRKCSLAASAAYATCSDFPIAVGTDSSGELFVNGGPAPVDPNWASDVSEARNSRRDAREPRLSVERENSGGASSQAGSFDTSVGPPNESGYGSEPGYRGDAEFGYGDELDEEEDDGRVLFWGDKLQGVPPETDGMEIVGENTFSEQKAHHRCRRKKHDWRMLGALR